MVRTPAATFFLMVAQPRARMRPIYPWAPPAPLGKVRPSAVNKIQEKGAHFSWLMLLAAT